MVCRSHVLGHVHVRVRGRKEDVPLHLLENVIAEKHHLLRGCETKTKGQQVRKKGSFHRKQNQAKTHEDSIFRRSLWH